MTVHIESLLIALIAYVYAVILTYDGMLFNGVYLRFERWFPEWLFYPLIGCVYCVSGQMALWYYLIKFWSEYNFIDHILFISITIFTVELIVKILTYNGTKKN